MIDRTCLTYWFITDMAEAHKSYHWDGCEHADDQLFDNSE